MHKKSFIFLSLLSSCIILPAEVERNQIVDRVLNPDVIRQGFENIFLGAAQACNSPEVKEAISGMFRGKAADFANEIGGAGGQVFGGVFRNFFHEVNNELGDEYQRDAEGVINNGVGPFIRGATKQFRNLVLTNSFYAMIGLFLLGSGWKFSVLFSDIVRDMYFNPRPKILMEGSDGAMIPFAKRIMYGAVSLFVSKKKSQKIEMVFSEDFQNKVEAFKFETQNIQQHIKAGNPNIQMSNKIFYGPPGTGKTMLAKQLAEESGLEWVYISAAALLQDKAGIEEIDKVFDWANNKKGVFIFFDEADALFKKREVGSDESKLVNHILAYLGTRNQNFMVVASTNILDSFDAAMERRFDDIIYFDLPGETERHQALSMYRDTVLLDKHNGQAFVDFAKNYLTDEKIAYIAKKTEGSSYGHISGVINQILIKCLVVGKELNDELIDQIIYDMTHKQTLFS